MVGASVGFSPCDSRDGLSTCPEALTLVGQIVQVWCPVPGTLNPKVTVLVIREVAEFCGLRGRA